MLSSTNLLLLACPTPSAGFLSIVDLDQLFRGSNLFKKPRNCQFLLIALLSHLSLCGFAAIYFPTVSIICYIKEAYINVTAQYGQSAAQTNPSENRSTLLCDPCGRTTLGHDDKIDENPNQNNTFSLSVKNIFS
jgi:hypothetical protein